MPLFNQKYWENFARKEWLVNVDRDCLFHQSVKSQKMHNKIIKIRGEYGVWLDEKQQTAKNL